MPAAKLLLFKHRNGQWCKKVKGKAYYFGTDYDKAVADYLDAKDHLLAGRGKPSKAETPTITELANLYYDGCRQRVSSGDLTQQSLDESASTLKRLIAYRGGKDQPSQWEPLDFKDIKQMLFEPVKRPDGLHGGRKVKGDRRAASTVNGDIRRIKAFLHWCRDAKLIPPPDFGQEFKESSARVTRLARVAAGKRTLERDEILAILGEVSPHFLPVVLLGINGGMGARDIAQLTLSQVANTEWLDCPRQKTGAARKVWLWPETRKAISDYLANRGEPWREQYADFAFLTTHRVPWVRGAMDSATQMFTKARKSAGLDSGTFYDLRRTFQTRADDSLDFPAVQFVMGHIPSSGDMSAKYREVSDERIKSVCQCVRTWLYGKRKAK